LTFWCSTSRCVDSPLLLSGCSLTLTLNVLQTSSLDAHAQNQIFETIAKISKSPTGDRKKTVIYITHRLSTARRADKVAMMDNGVSCRFKLGSGLTSMFRLGMIVFSFPRVFAHAVAIPLPVGADDYPRTCVCGNPDGVSRSPRRWMIANKLKLSFDVVVGLSCLLPFPTSYSPSSTCLLRC